MSGAEMKGMTVLLHGALFIWFDKHVLRGTEGFTMSWADLALE